MSSTPRRLSTLATHTPEGPDPSTAEPTSLTAHWLSRPEREALHEAVTAALQEAPCPLHPVLSSHLRAVLVELDVAPARQALWPAASQVARTAAHLPADVVAVRLSDQEANAVQALPLADPLRAALT